MIPSKKHYGGPIAPLKPRDEFVLSVPSDDNDSDPIRILPAEGMSRAELARALEQESVKDQSDDAPTPSGETGLRFTLCDLLLLMSVAAAGLAGGHWVPPEVFAGVLGIATLVVLVLITVALPESRLSRLVWTYMITLYFVAAISAVILRTISAVMHSGRGP
jgi:hypothetical protein